MQIFRRLKFITLLVTGSVSILKAGAKESGSFFKDPVPRVVTARFSDYKIVVAKGSSIDLGAAKELQKYLKICSGAQLEIDDDSAPVSAAEFVIGLHNLHNKSNDNLASKLTKDGYYQVINKGKIYIAGNDNGSMYGVYNFLEHFLGCRKLSANYTLTPHATDLNIPSTFSIISNPAFMYRYGYTFDGNKKDYADWHGLNSINEWGLFGHSFATLVPPGKYFAHHPDFFALYQKKRNQAQLNPSSDGMTKVLMHNLDSAMKLRSWAKIWSVSQNDGDVYCQCDTCQAINAKEGTAEGANLLLVNKVAKAHPDKTIASLAYRFSRKPPMSVNAEPNVCIMLADIEVKRGLPIESDPASASFRQDLDGWKTRSKEMFVWDYIIQFNHYLDPFPNLYTIQPNLAYFKKMGVKMIFEQGNSDCPGEFSELRSYLISKLMWDPSLNFDQLMDEFLSGYYGKGAPFIKQYIITLNKNFQASGLQLGIYDNPIIPISSYLSPDKIRQYQDLIKQAQNAVINDPDRLKHVIECNLPLEYAALTQAARRNTQEDGVFVKNNAGKYKIRDGFRERVSKFVEDCKAAGITKMRENGETPDQYLSDWNSNVFKNEQ